MDIAQRLQRVEHRPIEWARVRLQLLGAVLVALGILLVVSKLTSEPRRAEPAGPSERTTAIAGNETIAAPPIAEAAPAPVAEPPAERFIEARNSGEAGIERALPTADTSSAAQLIPAADLLTFAALIAPPAVSAELPEPANTAPAAVPALAMPSDDESDARMLRAELLALPNPPASEPAPVAAPEPQAQAVALAAQTVQPVAGAPSQPAEPSAPAVEGSSAPAESAQESIVAALTPEPSDPNGNARADDTLSFDDLLDISSPDTHAESHYETNASKTPPAMVVASGAASSADSVVVEVKPDGTIVQGEPQTQEDLVKEMKQLQEKFDQLQETVNIVVTQMMSDVETENAQLRAEVKRLQARDQAGLLASNAVPKPGGELLDQLAQEARDTPPGELEHDPLPPAAFSFNVMKEWGREPEAAKQLGGKVVTLKGVIGTVPLGSTREDIEQLGRDLRAQYSAYDNINVEVFDDPVAAQAFVDSQTIDPDHHVLSVSKYSATNHDAITYYDGGEATDLLPQVPGAVAQQLPEQPEVSVQQDLPQEAPQDTPDLGSETDTKEAAPAPSAAASKDSPKSIYTKRGHRSGR